MTNLISAGVPTTGVVSQPADNPKTIEGAAKQFEALLIGQILKSADESRSDGLGDEKDSASESMRDLANQQMAQLIANHGGLGLTKMIVRGLNQGVENAHSSSQSHL
jgi:Rod binding domain-containing protein